MMAFFLFYLLPMALCLAIAYACHKSRALSRMFDIKTIVGLIAFCVFAFVPVLNIVAGVILTICCLASDWEDVAHLRLHASESRYS